MAEHSSIGPTIRELIGFSLPIQESAVADGNVPGATTVKFDPWI